MRPALAASVATEAAPRTFADTIPRPRRLGFARLMLLGFALAPTTMAHAAAITLQGAFTRDDQVQLFDLAVTAPGTVDIRSFGYAGGTTTTGVVVPRGGFDTVLTLFSAAGTFIADNDDGAGVATDPATGLASDARITRALAPGSYVVALTQYDNFALGSTLADGFSEMGNPNFTADPNFAGGAPCPGGMFRDISGTAGRCRTGSWSVDFVDVASATPRGVTPIPEPASMALLGTGLIGLGLVTRRPTRAQPRGALIRMPAPAVAGDRRPAPPSQGAVP